MQILRTTLAWDGKLKANGHRFLHRWVWCTTFITKTLLWLIRAGDAFVLLAEHCWLDDRPEEQQRGVNGWEGSLGETNEWTAGWWDSTKTWSEPICTDLHLVLHYQASPDISLLAPVFCWHHKRVCDGPRSSANCRYFPPLFYFHLFQANY